MPFLHRIDLKSRNQRKNIYVHFVKITEIVISVELIYMEDEN